MDAPPSQAEVREDEEQHIKLQETIELLLAAGYFRARIKGLSPFDKVVGGMTWCITTCNFDVDVDLLFQENSTIGQKIALTEKIVRVLPRMKCPHRLEPHQIQGLDFIHIYPTVQWLVKKAIETREELGDYNRAFSVSQFSKHYSTPQDDEFEERKDQCFDSVKNIKSSYKPRRRYRRSHGLRSQDEEMRIHSTLLEYGKKFGIAQPSKSAKEGLDDKKKAVAGIVGGGKDEEVSNAVDEKRIKDLMKGMSVTEEGQITVSAVGSIVGLQSEEIQQIASHYADKQQELSTEDRPERLTGAQAHKRQIASLNKQILVQEKKFDEVKSNHEKLQQSYQETQKRMEEIKLTCAKVDEEMAKLEEMETEENSEILKSLRSLVAMNENLKKQEQEFRAHCKEELARLQQQIAELKGDVGEDTEDDERSQLIEKQYKSDKEKLQKIRLLLARKNREISVLQRKIDEVPSRAELSQYQRRFVELYNQVGSTHTETKQFYTLYNTLDDTKLYLEKEVNLLNSIHDNFTQAMSSISNKEQFLKQFEQIVEGIKSNRTKVEKKKQEAKMRRDHLNDTYLDLIDKQRLYFKTVKDFKEECRKNEILLSKLQK
ncbi:coiled-coil domain-containing protein 93-like [Ptychodera flava]|uniref:coiled-coil domain-containing protein 93-like n=1 Tax=Ptychodera flava TaxID=63121 RepID=UPI003969D733